MSQTNKAKQYLSYYEAMRDEGEVPMTWAEWLKAKKKKKSNTTRTTSVENQILNAGSLSADELAKLRD